MADCLIALGANLGDRAANLQAAIQELGQTPGIAGLVVSQLLETAAVGGPKDQPAFLNAAARFTCELSPLSLVRRLQQIETQLGREREIRWEARNIDLDLLLYDDFVCHVSELELPHPRMTLRSFVLQPAAEIAADMRHPGTGLTLAEHLSHIVKSPPQLAILGGSAEQRQRIAELAADLLGGSVCTAGVPNTDAIAEPQANLPWRILPDWKLPPGQDSTAGGAPIRFFALLEGGPTETVTDQQPTGNATISQEMAIAVTKSCCGSYLRVHAQQQTDQIVAEIVAAANASESG